LFDLNNSASTLQHHQGAAVLALLDAIRVGKGAEEHGGTGRRFGHGLEAGLVIAVDQ